MPGEFVNFVDVERVAPTELASAKLALEALGTTCQIYTDAGLTIGEREFKTIEFKMVSVLSAALSVVDKCRNDSVPSASFLGFVRREVSDKLSPILDDQLKLNSGDEIKIQALRPQTLVELVLAFLSKVDDAAARATTSPMSINTEPLKNDYLLIASQPSLEHFPRIAKLIDDRLSDHSLSTRDFLLTLPRLDSLALLTPSEKAGLELLLESKNKDNRWFRGNDIELLQKMLRSHAALSDSEPEIVPLNHIQELYDALGDLVTEYEQQVDAARFNTSINPSEVFETYGLTSIVRVREILMVLNSMLDITKDPNFVAWRDAALKIQLRNTYPTGIYYSSFMGMLESGSEPPTESQREDLRSALSILEAQKMSTGRIKYNDPKGTGYNAKLKTAKDEFLNSEIARVRALLSVSADGVGEVTEVESGGIYPTNAFGLFQALREFMLHATGQKGAAARIVTVNAVRTNYSKEMLDAENEMSRILRELPDGEASKYANMFATQTQNVWDFCFRSMDGSAWSVQCLSLNEVMNNYIKPQKILELARYYGFYQDLFLQRSIALKMMLGTHPKTRGKYSYPNYYAERVSPLPGEVPQSDGKVPNTFEEDLLAAFLDEGGYGNIDGYMTAHPNIPPMSFDVMWNFMWSVNKGPARLADEAYSLVAMRGASLNHQTENLPGDKEGKGSIPQIMNPLTYALYNIVNAPSSSEPAKMVAALFSDAYIDAVYAQIGIETPAVVKEYRHECYEFMEGEVGKENVDKIFGVIDLPDVETVKRIKNPLGDQYANWATIFPNILESMLSQDLDEYNRVYKVDLSGLAWIVMTLWEPLPELDENTALAKINDFIKYGYGRLKLGKSGVPRDAALALIDFYISRIFRALDYGNASRIDPDFIKLRPVDGRLALVNGLRVKVADAFGKGASTLRYYGEETSETDPSEITQENKRRSIGFRCDVLRCLGAADLHIPGIKNSSLLAEEVVEVESWGPIPIHYLKTLNTDDVNRYVMHEWAKYSNGSLGQRLAHFKALVMAAQNPEGLIEHFHPPYNFVAEQEKKKK